MDLFVKILGLFFFWEEYFLLNRCILFQDLKRNWELKSKIVGKITGIQGVSYIVEVFEKQEAIMLF